MDENKEKLQILSQVGSMTGKACRHPITSHPPALSRMTVELLKVSRFVSDRYGLWVTRPQLNANVFELPSTVPMGLPVGLNGRIFVTAFDGAPVASIEAYL